MNFPLAESRQPRLLELGLFPPDVANHLSLDTYAEGEGLMVGDEVTVSRRLLPPAQGVVVGLHNPHRPRGRINDRFAIDGVLVRTKGTARYCRPARVRLARRPAEYRSYWVARYDQDVAYWRESAEQDPLHPRAESGDSHRDGLTSVDPQLSLHNGVHVAFSGKDDGLAQALYRRAMIQADHLLGRMGSKPEGAEAATRLVLRDRELNLRRARAVAAALSGEPLDANCLLESARFWAMECTEVPTGYWDGLHKLKLLRAAMWAMIAGDLACARELLSTKRSFSNHQDHHQLLRKIVRKSVSPHSDRDLADRCRTFFDFIRHPIVSAHRETFDALETALEWAALMAKFIDRPCEEIDWSVVVETTSR